jgi:hypothetical protein
MRRTDSAVAGMVILGISAPMVVVAGLVMNFPWQAILLVVAATVISLALITAMASAEEQRDTHHWQEAVVAVSAWASRNAGRCETSPHAFPDHEWTLPGSPRFLGTILAVGLRDGFEIGVACSEVSEGENGATRRTAFLVRLSREYPHVRLKPSRMRRAPVADLPEPAGRRLATLPPRAELVEIQSRELYIQYHGWPEFLDLDVRVDAGIEVARALHREDTG